MALQPGQFAAVGAIACALNQYSGIDLWTEERVRAALHRVQLFYVGYGHMEPPGFHQSFPPTLAVVQTAAPATPHLSLRIEVLRGGHEWPT